MDEFNPASHFADDVDLRPYLDPWHDEVGLRKASAISLAGDGTPEWQFHSGQYRAWIHPARTKVIVAGRRWGKLTPLDTPIPTPHGWATMGSLIVGSEVFDEQGRVCRVTELSAIEIPERAYRLTFSDGTSIDASGTHEWVTWTHVERKAYLRSGGGHVNAGPRKLGLPDDWPNWRSATRWGAGTGSIGPQTRTTDELYATRTYGKRGDANHSIPVCGPLDLPDRDLRVDPRLLGLWLGDGHSSMAAITTADQQLAEEFRAAGYGVTKYSGKYAYGITGGFLAALRTAGVLNNKHVPAAYLRASARQRLALLQGLMDTDGYAERSKVEFCNTNKSLVDAVVELARSLGQKPVVYEGRATLNGVDHGPKWRVCWKPTIEVFRLERKRKRVVIGAERAAQAYHRMIVSIEPIESVPMRCIAVDSPNRMYLAGDGMIPTHNSQFALRWILAGAMNDNLRGVGGVSWVVMPTYVMARNLWPELLQLAPPGWITHTSGTYTHPDYVEVGRSRIEFKSAEHPQRLVGVGLRRVLLDEAGQMRGAVFNEAIMPTLVDHGAPALLTGTPRGRNWFWKLYSDGLDPLQPDIATFGGPSTQNPFIKAEEVARMKRRMPARLFRQEFLAEFLTDDGAVFRGVQKCVDLTNGQYSKERTVSIGVDLARKTDFTVLVGLDKQRNVTYFNRWEKVDWPLQKKRIKAAYERLGKPVMLMDATGVGDPIVQDLQRAGMRRLQGFVFTPNSKADIIDGLTIAVENREIGLPDEPVLINELHGFSYTTTAAGRTKYGAPEDGFDDCVCALALALKGHKRAGNSGVTI